MSDHQKLAAQIVEMAGGAKNIKSITNCATRLRMYIYDPDKFNQEGMGKIKGVMGVQLSGAQHQVIVGPTAIHLCKEIRECCFELLQSNSAFRWIANEQDQYCNCNNHCTSFYCTTILFHKLFHGNLPPSIVTRFSCR